MLILSLVGNARVQLRGASISVVAAGSHWRLLGGIGGKSEWLYEMLLWIACRDPGEGSEVKRKLQEIKLYQLRSRMSRRSKFCLRRAFRQEYHSQITIHGSLTWIRTSWSWTTSERPTDGVGYFGDICSWTPPIWLLPHCVFFAAFHCRFESSSHAISMSAYLREQRRELYSRSGELQGG